MFFSGKNSGMQFFSRGDIASWDRDVGDFTKDDNWHSWDLSSIIPENTKLVLIRVYITATTNPETVRLRKHGNENTTNIAGLATNVAGRYVEDSFLVEPDNDRVIDYYLSAGTWVSCYMFIRGWWI